MLGYHSQVILAGRRINDGMGKYVAENCVKQLIAARKPVMDAKVAILGFTFKENCPDTRNTRVIDIVKELEEYGIEPLIADPVADKDEAKRIYGLEFCSLDEICDMDAVILAVAHDCFKGMDMSRFFSEGEKVLLDVKGIQKSEDYKDYMLWRL